MSDRTSFALRRARVLSWVVPLLVLAASGAVSWKFWDRERRDIETELRTEFDTRVRETVGLFRERMLAYEQALRATHGLFATSAHVERGDFQAFVASLRIETHPGLQGMGYSLRVPARERERHEAQVRLKGFPNYAITPAGDRPELTTALYFEPSGSSLLSTLGSDYYAEPSRRHAMDAARDSGSIAISNKIRLPEEDAEAVQAGYRMYLPVYGGAAPPASVDERRRALTGWIYAAFSMDGLMSNILGERPNIAVEVHDAGVGAGDEQLEDTLSDRVGGESSVKLLFASQRVQVGGYTWAVTAQSLPNLSAPGATNRLRLAAVVGAGTSLLLAALAFAIMRRRIRALQDDELLRLGKQRAEASSLAKSQFLAAASHDLRQPVQALGLFTATLQAMARKPQLEGAEVAQVATRLQLALHGLGRLLNGLFELSGLDSGAVTVAPRPVDLRELLDELQSAFDGPAREKGLQFHAVLPRNLWVQADPLVLSRVLSNLVANAIRYTQAGRVVIGCRRRAQDRVEIQVIDTGIGIAAEEQGRIFGEFYQVAGVRRERERGMGLGLAIAQRSMQLLGGTIAVRSQPGHGSLFSVTLPRAQAPAPLQGDEPARPAGDERRKVLVVDDDPQLVEAMQGWLRESGYEAVAAESVGSAYRASVSAAHALCAIVSDWQLGAGESGLDAIRAARQGIGRDVPAIVVTGDTSASTAALAQEHGFALLHKPVDPAALLALLTRSRASP